MRAIVITSTEAAQSQVLPQPKLKVADLEDFFKHLPFLSEANSKAFENDLKTIRQEMKI